MGLVNAFFETLHWRILAGGLSTQAFAIGYLVLVLVLAAIASTYLVYLLDTSHLSTRQVLGVIDRTVYIPATESLTIYAPHFNLRPERFSVRIRVGKHYAWTDVSKSDYARARTGVPILVRFTIRRVSRKVSIVSIP